MSNVIFAALGFALALGPSAAPLRSQGVPQAQDSSNPGKAPAIPSPFGPGSITSDQVASGRGVRAVPELSLPPLPARPSRSETGP